MAKSKSIVYVNFSPYENAGKVLDFILDNFEVVILFSINFHHLGKSQKPGKIYVYKKKKLKKQYPLIDMPFRIPASVNFFLLPIRSLINLLQISWYLWRFKKEFGKFDVYFTVNAFTAWIGNIARSLKLVNQTIFWVWDYYPPYHTNKVVLLMRWLYWQFDKSASKSNKLIFMNKRLENLRKDINIIHKDSNYLIVPIGTDPIAKIKKRNKNKIVVGFLGVLKKSQGLGLFFDLSKKIHQKFPNLELQIIGAGPDEEYFKSRAKNSDVPVTFFGFVPNEKKVKEIQMKWDIAIALYVPEESNVSYYTDPSKIKSYLSFSIPVIITDVAFSDEVKIEHAGVIIDYFDHKDLVNAISKIMYDYKSFQKNALRLSKKYYYKKMYSKMFSD